MMTTIKIWRTGYVLLAMIILLTSCGQPASDTVQPGAISREATIALPTSAPLPEHTPANTRVLPPQSLTPTLTPSITPIPDEVQGLVIDVIDGHTISVVLQGDPLNQAYLVRYLGINSPSPEQPWGAVAYDTNRKMTSMKAVRLVRDTSDFDDEGYLLRYVYAGDQLLSIILTEQGLARAAITPPDTRFEAEILEAEARAKNGKLGLWGGTPTPTPSPGPEQEGTLEPTTEAAAPTNLTATTEPATPQQTPSANTPTTESESTTEATSENTPEATPTP